MGNGLPSIGSITASSSFQLGRARTQDPPAQFTDYCWTADAGRDLFHRLSPRRYRR